MYKHYIRINESNAIIHGFSDAPEWMSEKDRGQDNENYVRPTDIVIYEGDKRHFDLFGISNPPLTTTVGISLYLWDGRQVQHRHQEDIDADILSAKTAEAAMAREKTQQAYAATKLQTIAMLADIGVVNMEDAATITAFMEIDLSTIAKPWTVGTWYSAGDTVDHNGDYYLVRDPHAAQAHQPPGAEGVYHYIPIPSTEDGYPVFEMGMYVHTGMIVWDAGKTQLYKCILPNITKDDPYQCHFAPGSAPTVWVKHEAA